MNGCSSRAYCTSFPRLVDNETAVENIKRFAAHSGYQAASREDGDDYCLTLTKK